MVWIPHGSGAEEPSTDDHLQGLQTNLPSASDYSNQCGPPINQPAREVAWVQVSSVTFTSSHNITRLPKTFFHLCCGCSCYQKHKFTSFIKLYLTCWHHVWNKCHTSWMSYCFKRTEKAKSTISISLLRLIFVLVKVLSTLTQQMVVVMVPFQVH